MVPKSLDAVLITRPLAGFAALVGVGFVAEDDGDVVSASELVPFEDWLLEVRVFEPSHPASRKAAVRTRATTARMRRAKHGHQMKGRKKWSSPRT
jgi:hypothetical protein